MSCRLSLVAALVVASLTLPPLASAQLDPSCGTFAATRLRLRKLDYDLGGQRLLFRGTVQIPVATTVDPADTGLRFRMTDSAGHVMADVTLPGGPPTPTDPGWVTSGASGSATYRDRRGTHGGILRVLVRRSPARPTDTKILLFGQDMSFDKPVHDVFVHVYLVDDGGASVCGGRHFRESECSYRNLGGKLNCY
ncbi:MAG TPA: hypothetical protein VGR62_13825 [Candidatus Binatia bacterium]|jgi:hypothetical protein|nr:hypothetical protein [Candidatus Binatia bacterium]